MPLPERAEVVIIGAGAAGLAAAQVLSSCGASVVVVEARDRAGGRIHTLADPAFPLPVELGAEFIHGRDSDTFRLLRAAGGGGAAYRADGDHLEFRGGRLVPLKGFWEEIDQVMSRLAALGKGPGGARDGARGGSRHAGGDVTFDEFLRRCCAAPSLRAARERARGFVEGFDAAHADRISALSLKQAEDASGDGPEGEESFRLLGGYGRVIDHLLRTARPDRLDLRLRTVVRRVRWGPSGGSPGAGRGGGDDDGRGARRGGRGNRGGADAGVRIECETASGTPLPPVVARRAIVTLPVGVLRAGDVAFEPELPPAKRRAIELLEPGPVVKVILKFRESFWESPLPAARGKSLANLCFLHGPARAAVPTWWTYFPVRAAVLTGWAGGPAADRLSHRPAREILGEALDALAGMTGLARDQLDGLLDAAHVADWQADPFSRGAYSYIAVGGIGAPKALARPLDDVLFFAGEATGSEGIGGTVDAAISSGHRAAREILAAPSRPPATVRRRP